MAILSGEFSVAAAVSASAAHVVYLSQLTTDQILDTGIYFHFL